MSLVARIHFEDYETSVGRALDAVGAAEILPAEGVIVIKPNLTNADGPPVTTPVACVAAVAAYCRRHSGAEVVVGEGCGSGTTAETFRANGYTDWAAEAGVRLVDFNTAEAVRMRNPAARQLREFHMPALLGEAFVISVPILKDHSFTTTTIAMKNMFGMAPAPFYRGSWNKSALHRPSTHESVVDVCRYKCPGLCVVDAVTALTGMHLAGEPRRFDKILAGADPVAVDAVGSEMLGHDPRAIEYLVSADGELGSLDDIEVVER